MCNIEYEIPEAGNVTVKIVDILGSTVMVIMNEHEKAGKYSVNLNGESLSAGKYYFKVYLTTLRNGSLESTEKNMISSGQVKV